MGTNATVRAAEPFGGRPLSSQMPTRSLTVAGLVRTIVEALRLRIARFNDQRELARQRRALLDLDQHLLSDIGLTRDQACYEARKGFWG